MDLLIWGGPVFAPGSSPYPGGDVGKVRWENPTEILTITGAGSDYFAGLAKDWKDPTTGRVLPGLLASYDKRVADYDHIAIAGFSAFHGLANQLLLSAEDRNDISVAVLLDSCFTAADGYQGKPGYVEFGKLASAGEKLLVMTASNGRNSPPLPPSSSGSECAFQSFVDATSGVYEWFDVPTTLPEIPAYFSGSEAGGGPRSLRSGDFFLLDYAGTMLHHSHVNEISAEVLSTFLAPYLGGNFEHGASPVLSARNLGYAAGAAGVALALYLLLRSSKGSLNQ